MVEPEGYSYLTRARPYCEAVTKGGESNFALISSQKMIGTWELEEPVDCGTGLVTSVTEVLICMICRASYPA